MPANSVIPKPKRHADPISIAPKVAGGDYVKDTKVRVDFACQSCARSKVKCDRTSPSCSRCISRKLNCVYQPPQPPRKRIRTNGDISDKEKLLLYEQILREHDLLPSGAQRELVSLPFNDLDSSGSGKILASNGKSRYVRSNLWHNLGDDEMHNISDDEGDEQIEHDPKSDVILDPLTGSFIGSPVNNIRTQLPSYERAEVLWKVFIENVNPVSKIIHVPSTHEMLKSLHSLEYDSQSKSGRSLLFAVYHFAVFSMTEAECLQKLGDSRQRLLQEYHLSTRCALVEASFLKTTEMNVLQAYTLFLLACRYSYDPHTYWILTGVALRIAQRMGLQKDGTKLGLSPFDVQMRRRLFYQLIPLDGVAGHMSGTGIDTLPESWDTQPAANIDDSQIWPGMETSPGDKDGASEMMFCLARLCIGTYLVKNGRFTRNEHDDAEFERIMAQAQKEVDEKYISHCDVVNPLHFLTMCSVKAGIAAMRLSHRLSRARTRDITREEKLEMVHLAESIIDTDAATHANTSLKRFAWYMRPFFLWGTWDSLIVILTSLCRQDLLSKEQGTDAWKRIDQLYGNHADLLTSKRALYVAFGRLALRAWEANPSEQTQEPNFIQILRSARLKLQSQSLESSSTSSLEHFGESMIATDSELNFDSLEWDFWQKLIKDDQYFEFE